MDNLATFETANQANSTAPARYAIRQALDQEYQKYLLRRNTDARQARYNAGNNLHPGDDVGQDIAVGSAVPSSTGSKPPPPAKRDFFGRIIEDVRPSSKDGSAMPSQALEVSEKAENRKVWVSFHEGFSNAVRKPITLDELMRGF